MWMYLQATTMQVWSIRGQTPSVSVDAGRSRIGFYGTLDVQTGQQIVTRACVLNSVTTALHLEQILQAIPNRPILLLWDRATWHHGAPVRAVLDANPRLQVMPFPTAAPDLNPQEQVWKQTRRAVGHNHLTPRLHQLADQTEAFLRTHTFQSSFLQRYGFHLVCPFLN